jgi:hypothetical protein
MAVNDERLCGAELRNLMHYKDQREMVQIQVSRVIPAPKPREYGDEHIFERGDGIWTLVLHDPEEFHMGAYAWQLKLLRNDDDVSASHQILNSSRALFRLPMNYAPWCRSDPIVVLIQWDSVIHLYNVDDRKSLRRELGQDPLQIQWAPAGDLLAITYDGLVQILDISAEDVASISIRHPQNEYPGVFWWRDGKQILVVGRESQSSKSRLSVFDATSGRLLGITDFDPLDLLPYEQAAYTRLSRDGYSLKTGWGVRSAGYLLDTWSQLEFDADQCLLRGTVYRPEGPCEQEGDTFRCVASERGIEVTVRT